MLVRAFPSSITSVAVIATGSAAWDQLEFLQIRTIVQDGARSEVLQHQIEKPLWFAWRTGAFAAKLSEWNAEDGALSVTAVCVWGTATLENSLGILSKVGLRKKRFKLQKHLSLLQGIA